MKPRTRFAPSPTGHVHIGNMRTAIFAWLFARHEGGAFLLRVEDTDRDRSTPEAVQTVLDAMNWLGLDADEEPVYQSTRMECHLAAAEQLLASGHACKEDKGGKGECIVFKMPGNDIFFDDEIRGTLTKKAEDMQDLVIVRSNGTPVFHLANVVDDIHMGITHVIRGDDHIENTYRHVALYEALGAPAPRFAHLPMIVNHQGKPYSKRDGDAYVGDFREKGYLADALFNYLALLGWSPGDDREVMTRDELITAFELKKVQTSPAKMDFKKLDWMNGEHIRRLPREVYLSTCRQILTAHGLWKGGNDEAYFTAVIDLMAERIKCWADLPKQAAFFFTDDYPVNEKAVRKRLDKEGARDRLKALRDRFASLEPFSAETAEQALTSLAEETGEGNGAFIHPCRVAVSGLSGGPGLYEMLAVLGKERVLERMDRVVRNGG